MTRQLSLLINDQPIQIDYFVQSFIDHTMGGMLEALEGTGEIKSVDAAIAGDKVTIKLDNAEVPVNPFVNKIIRNTIVGMLSSLKGVGEIKRANITIKR